MKVRIVLVVALVAGAALAFWMGVPFPRNLRTATFIVVGCGLLVNALLLGMNVVNPGPVWGQTASGMGLLGLGALLIGFAWQYEEHLGTVLGALGLISFTIGLLLERNAKRV